MNDAASRHGDHVQDWLFAILRFAVTLEDCHRAAVMAHVDAMDRLATDHGQAGFAFFLRTSEEFCDAIAAPDGPSKSAVLRRHLSQIENDRLRAALAAALEIERSAKRAYRAAKRSDVGAFGCGLVTTDQRDADIR